MPPCRASHLVQSAPLVQRLARLVHLAALAAPRGSSSPPIGSRPVSSPSRSQSAPSFARSGGRPLRSKHPLAGGPGRTPCIFTRRRGRQNRFISSRFVFAGDLPLQLGVRADKASKYPHRCGSLAHGPSADRPNAAAAAVTRVLTVSRVCPMVCVSARLSPLLCVFHLLRDLCVVLVRSQMTDVTCVRLEETAKQQTGART